MRFKALHDAWSKAYKETRDSVAKMRETAIQEPIQGNMM